MKHLGGGEDSHSHLSTVYLPYTGCFAIISLCQQKSAFRLKGAALTPHHDLNFATVSLE